MPLNPDGIFYADTSTEMSIADITSAMATSIGDKLGGIEQTQTVNSQAERDLLYPAPVQGNSVFRNDLGFIQTYYGAWNSSTNPGGRASAGWYNDQRNMGLVPIVPSTVTIPIGGSATANSIGIVSFTSIASVELGNVFSSTYKSYKVFVEITGGSVSNDIPLYLRMPGATTGYSTQYFRAYNASLNAGRDSATTYFWLGPAGYSTWASFEVNITNPNVAVKTGFISYGGGDNQATERMFQANVGYLNNTTQYTGLQMAVTSGNITGTIQILGYNS